jgi:RHH-type transcriptional regulator, proline utilization regulon repressor / proline dehydrogenase / delta 1-pyrroline-5-carboxylate dehydrogenase
MPSAALDDSLERRIGEIGAAAFDRIGAARARPWQVRWWEERGMNWSMGDPALKVQMLRFVDVLPSLPDSRAVAEHIQSHFAHGSGLEKLGARIPWPLRWSSRLAKPGTMFGNLAAWIARSNAERMARRFIAGYDGPEVLRSVAKLRAQGCAFTLDLLGEATVTEGESDAYRDEYLRLLDALGPAARDWAPNPLLDTVEGTPLPRVNVSVKLTALNS